MQAPLPPPDETARLAALHGYGVLDTPPETAFDDLTRLAAEIFGAPIALVSLVDRDRQWFKARLGLEATETPRDISFCGHAILEPESILVVPDARADERFADNPLVTGHPFLRFYAGAPLISPGGQALGTLCVASPEPFHPEPRQIQALRVLARQVVAQLKLRRQLSALQEGEQKYRTVLDNIREVIFQTDATGRWTFLNPAWKEITGFSVVESLGTPCLHYVHPDDRSRTEAHLRALVTREKDHCRHEMRYLTRDGGVRWVEVFARVNLDAEGRVTGISGTLNDVTQSREAEENLRRSEERLSLALEGTDIGLWDCNVVTGAIYFSAHWTRMLGHHGGAIESHIAAWLPILHPEDRAATESRLRAHLEGASTQFLAEFRVRTKSGDWRWIRAVGRVMTWEAEAGPAA